MSQTTANNQEAMVPPNGGGNNIRPFGLKDKVGYLLGDFGNDFSFILVSAFLMVYYTDVFGVSAGAVGTLFLVARLWDAVTDVLWGRFIDSRKTTSMGKFRPWIFRMSFPLVISSVLLFTYIPGMGDGFYLAYAYVTYILWGMLYTTVNIPYGSMAAVISDDAVHRTQLSGWRTMGAMAANLFINALAPLIVFVDNELSANRMFMTAVVFSILALACFMGCVKLSRERIQNPDTKPGEGNSLGKTFKALLKNRPLISILLASLLFMMCMLLVGTINVYLFKDYFGSASTMSIFGVLQGAAVFLMMPTLKPLVGRFGKKEMAASGMLFAGTFYIVLYFIPNISLTMFLILNGIGLLGFALFNLIIWAFVTDAIDYQEYLTGEREDGTVYAVYSFARKVGQAFAGGLGGYALALIGYNEGASTQTEAVKDGIYAVATLVPGVIYIIVFLLVVFAYPLNKKRTNQLATDLAQKREEKLDNE
ncbi:MFS transporter [Aquibacillus sediminis]|uniref:MFS transporter n=1 Tax=Aquibacillus sediminis TaxID=2574734 RepID=UPI0011098047|nr:MFS transporter [Aquibacillus sediminis]